MEPTCGKQVYAGRTQTRARLRARAVLLPTTGGPFIFRPFAWNLGGVLYPTAKESDWIILLYSTGGPPVLDYGQAGSISPAAAVAKKAAVCVTGLGDCDAADRASSACLLLPLQARKISSALVLVCFVCSCGFRKVALARAKSVSVSSASNDKQTCLASRSWSDCLERWNRFLSFLL